MGDSMILKWTDQQLENARLPKKRVESIARRLQHLSREMEELGLMVWGNGEGVLIHYSRPIHWATDLTAGIRAKFLEYEDEPQDVSGGDPGAVIADLGPHFDGGDW